MYIMKNSTVINGKVYNHYKLVESYRQDGKVKKKQYIILEI